MAGNIRLGIIGDYDEQKVSHPATDASIRHAAAVLNCEVSYSWLPTESFLTAEGLEKLGGFDAYWISSGSPYKSYEGSMKAITYARESGKPFFST